MYSININNLNIDIYNKVGIFVSGGFDSAILLYILMKELKNKKNSFVNIYTRIPVNEKKFYNKRYIDKITNFCIEKTNNTNVKNILFYVEKQEKTNLFTVALNDLKNNEIDIIYTAVSANPPDNVKFSKDSLEYERRNPNIKRKYYYDDKSIYMPFTNINKKEIYNLYKIYDITQLINYTRSCESKFIKIGECGDCWWCKERKWALECNQC